MTAVERVRHSWNVAARPLPASPPPRVAGLTRRPKSPIPAAPHERVGWMSCPPASPPTPKKCFPAPKNFTFCTDRFTTQNFRFLHRTAKVLRLSERMSALRHTLQLFAPRAPCCHCATVQISLCSDILWAPKFFWNCPVLLVSQYGKTFIIRTESKVSGTVGTPSRSNSCSPVHFFFLSEQGLSKCLASSLGGTAGGVGR